VRLIRKRSRGTYRHSGLLDLHPIYLLTEAIAAAIPPRILSTALQRRDLSFYDELAKDSASLSLTLTHLESFDAAVGLAAIMRRQEYSREFLLGLLNLYNMLGTTSDACKREINISMRAGLPLQTSSE
jgi:hypothetical protein